MSSEDSVERVAAVLAAVQISISTRSDIPGEAERSRLLRPPRNCRL